MDENLPPITYSAPWSPGKYRHKWYPGRGITQGSKQVGNVRNLRLNLPWSPGKYQHKWYPGRGFTHAQKQVVFGAEPSCIEPLPEITGESGWLFGFRNKVIFTLLGITLGIAGTIILTKSGAIKKISKRVK